MSETTKKPVEPTTAHEDKPSLTYEQKLALAKESAHEVAYSISEALNNKCNYAICGWYFLVTNAQDLDVPFYTQEDQVCCFIGDILRVC
jgi:hypothetical protein